VGGGQSKSGGVSVSPVGENDADNEKVAVS
jgi:hypothetical protein